MKITNVYSKKKLGLYQTKQDLENDNQSDFQSTSQKPQ